MISFKDFFVVLLPKRRMTRLLLSIIYITTVWSWTSQRICFVPLVSRQSTTVMPTTKKASAFYRGRIIRGSQERQQPRSSVSFSRLGPLYYESNNQETCDIARNDSALVNALIRARSTKEVEITLKKSLSENYLNGAKASNDCVDMATKSAGIEMGVNETAIPFSCLSLNATAAALRRMAHISVLETRSGVTSDQKRIISENTTAFSISENGSKARKQMIANLLEAIGVKLMSHRSSLSPSSMQQTANPQELPGVHPLSDVLQALAVLAPDEKRSKKMRPFAVLVVEFLNTHETSDLYKLGPIKLVQCLQAMANLDIDHSSLYNKICDRLLKPDALSKLPARFLAHGLSTLATFQTAKANRKTGILPFSWKLGEQYDTEEINGNKEIDTDILLSRAFMRRLRKPKVRIEATSEDMYRALVATRDLFDLGVMTTMEDEAAILGFTSLRTILEIRSSSPTPFSLTPTHVTGMISSWASLSDQTREDTVIGELLQIWTEEEILERCSLGQMERILSSIRKLNAANNAEVTKRVGERVLSLVEENESSDFQNIFPDFAVEVLRWPVFAHRRNQTAMQPFVQTASLLFSRKSFIRRSSVKEISNFLWFLSIVEQFDEEILLNIGSCLLEDTMVDDCSPNIASRILATFTSLLVLEEKRLSQSLADLKQDLFYSYGGHLLSSNLSDAETSSALYAYAKANYVKDKGVFDHLVNLLASSKANCSSRQLSQTIWSCGKMIAWERQDMELLDDEEAEMEDPPYLENALKIAGELAARAEELSAVDVAQVMWGIGKLEILDEELMSVFGNRTIDISSSMNAAEISNVLWGVAKVQFRDGKLIGSLSDRLASNDIHVSSPRVASSILFSLARLQWKDEIVFEKLSKTMIDDIENVNAQSVANTLWAFRAVRMRPPRELLDTWAITTLGIVPAIGPPAVDNETPN